MCACMHDCNPEHTSTWMGPLQCFLWHAFVWLTLWRKQARWSASACAACGAGSAPSWRAAHRWGCQGMYGLSSPRLPGSPSSPWGPSPSPSPWWRAAAEDWAAGGGVGAVGSAQGHRWGLDRGSGPCFAKGPSTASRRRTWGGPAVSGHKARTHWAAVQK